jgi:preprotein translocase subunit YajC
MLDHTSTTKEKQMSNKLSPGDRVSVDAGLGITKTGNVQRITESTVFVKHYNGAVVGYRTQHVTKMLSEEVSAKPRGVGLKSEFDAFMQVMEKTLTPAELKKREEVAKAMERENPDMPMDKKMAIATATAKRVAEENDQVDESRQASTTMKHIKNPTAGEKKAAKDIKPGIAGYRDRIAMLKSAQADGRLKEGKAHTVPKTDKEKDLAAIAHPKDKITHADVLTGRGVKKEEMSSKEKMKRGLYNKEEAELEEATENLPGQRTHIMNKDVRHPEHGIISNGTVLRHTGGSNFEVRAGRAKGKIVNIPKEHVNKLDEEVEQIDELSSDLKSRYKQAASRSMDQAQDFKSELDSEGVPKKSPVRKDVNRIINNRKMGMKRANEDVELDEQQIDELSRGTISSYIKKAVGGGSGENRNNLVNTVRRRTSNAHNPVNTDAERNDSIKQANKDDLHFTNRVTGIRRATDRLAKEEVELDEAMISYSDFQSKIDAHRKAGNQIKDDKYDKKKASYTVVDQEGTAKKITHTDAGVSQQHLGSMKRDDSDDKSAETKPKETRGRGRPTGSKSGARN